MHGSRAIYGCMGRLSGPTSLKKADTVPLQQPLVVIMSSAGGRLGGILASLILCGCCACRHSHCEFMCNKTLCSVNPRWNSSSRLSNDHGKGGRKIARARGGGGPLQNGVFWMWRDYCTYERLTSAIRKVILCTL